MPSWTFAPESGKKDLSVSLLYFTCANRAYDDFVPLYVASGLWHAPGSRCEVGLEDLQSFEENHREALDLLLTWYGFDRILLRTANQFKESTRILPNTVRFIDEPNWSAEYIYVGDVDFLILRRDLQKQHITFMHKMGLSYSNSVRPNTRRMSGLHFSRYDALYPLPALTDLDLTKMNDEEVLYEICLRKGLEIQDKEWFRPEPGIHLSPNRSPLDRKVNGRLVPGWGIRPFAKAYSAFRNTKFFKELRPRLSDRVERCLTRVDEQVAQIHR